MKLDGKTTLAEEYWFSQIGDHFDVNYKSYIYFDNVLPKFVVPTEEGLVVQLGTNRAVSFNKLCEMYGPEKCLGFDHWNPSGHPRICELDCWNLEPMNLAFVDIDVGSLAETPRLRKHCLEWALKNTVMGGLILTNNKVANSFFEIDVEEYVKSQGYKVIQMDEYSGESWAVKMNASGRFNTCTAMVCQRIS